MRSLTGDEGQGTSTRGGRCTSHAPHRAPDIVCDEQCAVASDGNTHGTSQRVAVLEHEPRQHVTRHAGWPAVDKRHEDHLVAASRLAVPGTVLTDEHALALLRRAIGSR